MSPFLYNYVRNEKNKKPVPVKLLQRNKYNFFKTTAILSRKIESETSLYPVEQAAMSLLRTAGEFVLFSNIQQKHPHKTGKPSCTHTSTV
jgi:hypothetical protein